MITLLEKSSGREVPLDPLLRSLYGRLRIPRHLARPHVLANFAVSLDGVAALAPETRTLGVEITGGDPADRMILGLLRAISDAVIIGAGTLRASPRHRWTASRAAPALSEPFVDLRNRLHLGATPLNVVVSASGHLDLTLPLFRSGEVEVLVVTTAVGARRLATEHLPMGIQIAAAAPGPTIPAPAILRAVARVRACATILVEGGPHLFARFLSDRCLDELFLTIAPRMFGRDPDHPRLSLVEGLVSGSGAAPEGGLRSLRRGGELLFLRYGFPSR